MKFLLVGLYGIAFACLIMTSYCVGGYVARVQIIASCLSDQPKTLINGGEYFCSDYQSMQAFLLSISRPGTSA